MQQLQQEQMLRTMTGASIYRYKPVTGNGKVYTVMVRVTGQDQRGPDPLFPPLLARSGVKTGEVYRKGRNRAGIRTRHLYQNRRSPRRLADCGVLLSQILLAYDQSPRGRHIPAQCPPPLCGMHLHYPQFLSRHIIPLHS